MAGSHATTETSARILDSAEELVQRRGFNGFSYADIASELGVTTAGLHYHFTSKAELGRALIERYSARFTAALEAIDAEGGAAPLRLAKYARIYADVLQGHRMCLCGMLAADYETLPRAMRGEVIRFFDRNEDWLAGVLELGSAEGSLRFDSSPREAAQLLISGLEGAMLVARPYDDVGRFEAAAAALLSSMQPD